MASARLRKAFRYPDDSGDEDKREELDEEEQERVIEHLHLQNNKRNSEYTVIFAIIPLLSATVFLPSLFSTSLLYERFFAILGFLSLFATAYTMKYIPPQRPDPKGKRPMRNPDLSMQVQKFLLPTNVVVSVLLALVYVFSSKGGSSSSGTYPAVCLVPGCMLAAILVVRKEMISVDLKSLEDLRYDYKGA